MGIELEKKTMIDCVGKSTKFKAVFRGSYSSATVTLTMETETERDMFNIVPLIPGKILDLKIIDPQSTLDSFETEEQTIKQAEEDKQFRAERKKRAEEQL